MNTLQRAPITKVLFILKCLLFSYIVTGGLLLLLAFLLYRLHLSENIVNVCITLIYIITSFLAGFVSGKKYGSKKFLWGAALGTLYFVVLLLVSLVIRKSFAEISSNLVLTLVLCAGSGTLGGMIS